MYHEQPTRPIAHHVPAPPAARRRGCSCLGRLFLILLLGFTGTVVTGTLAYANMSREIEAGIVALDSARDRESFQTTRILDRNGRLLWEIFGEGKRTKVPLDQIPMDLRHATIATEDDTFYDNIGLDAPSLVAALIANLRNPEGRPVGGSTITQQLVRHIAFDYAERAEVSYDRKTKEVILAWIMNRTYAKDEILTMYLNEIYYGNLAYGVEAAAQTYFGKHATELTLAESSLLAALPQSPVELDPFRNLEVARQRQWLVLNLMVQEGYIGRQQAEQAYLAPLEFAAQEVSLEAPHFAIYVRQLLEQQFGAEVVANGGLRVTTSLSLDYQRLAEHLARQHVAALAADHNLSNASIVVLKPGAGEILAMLGSVNYHDDAIDGRVNVALSLQQPGSSIKPITYAAALSPLPETGQPAWTAADLLWDVPVRYPQFDGTAYRPVNYDGRFHGPLRLREALANSYNVPAVLLLQDVGVARFLELAGRMGISTLGGNPAQYGLSLTLGGGDVTPLELTGAYAVLANGGYRVAPAAILRVEDAAGQTLYEHQPVAEPILDPRVAFLISHILDDDNARIPAMSRDNPLALPFPAAVKTGTTNDFRDNWTIGYTPGLVVGVWTGNADNSQMIDVSGLTGAAPLWSAYMQAVYLDYDLLQLLTSNGAQPPTEFVAPPGLELRPICDLTSVTIAAADCRRAGQEFFLVTNTPADPFTNPAEPAVAWEKLDPAVWRVPAVTLPPELLVAQSDDEQTIPPQLFCHFSEGLPVLQLPPDAIASLFLAPPRNPESLPGAHRWAQERGIPLLPAAPCNDELLALARDPNAPAVWRIITPSAGQRVSGVLPIEGIASFDSAQVLFYKVELGMGDLNNPQWVTLGQTHDTPVVNGPLEVLHADALPPGDYLLRLIVVMNDGNYAGEPHTVAISVTR